MKQQIILYNPKAGGGQSEDGLKARNVFCQHAVYYDMTEITNHAEFFGRLDEEDEVILCGGDGTLNRFVNDTEGLNIKNPIFYYASGNGNDFLRDLDISGHADFVVPIGNYLQNLPKAIVNGGAYRFLNNVGFGLDGYCCEVGDRLCDEYKQKRQKKKVNYTMIAIKGLLFHFKPRNAVVTVDGVPHEFKNVWIAPTMNGRYYGGGMMAAPEQDRQNKEGVLSVMVLYGAGRLKTLCMFPSIFKGTHIRFGNHVSVLTGNEIKVAFDHPAPLQIDGETFLNVTEYLAHGCGCSREEDEPAESFIPA